MNETRDLMIGIDLGKDSSQLCYYDRKAFASGKGGQQSV